ncbi:MAG: carboxylating nicotinate-nucleotide diphosphorylase [Balneolaceae bacterium]|jgi:nicotinate-nucleotide pyrophosphorylase (carboxylating)
MNDLPTVLIDKKVIDKLIDQAFKEDIGSGDITTNAVIDEGCRADAIWKAKEAGIVAGLDVARAVFRALDPNLDWEPRVEDGTRVKVGQELVLMHGSCRAILTAERTALNIVQRMSGIASKTRHLVDAVAEYNTRILDTRKTVPGLRELDKYAVAAGGGMNHRMGLYDMAMIKDNHIVAAGGIRKAVKMVRESNPGVKVEVETTTLDEVDQALAAGADIIMLDNMSTEQMAAAVKTIGDRAKTEASGNITLARVKEVAKTGVDYISVGALTHSVEAFDISQELQKNY